MIGARRRTPRVRQFSAAIALAMAVPAACGAEAEPRNAEAEPRPRVVVVIGAPGTDKYAAMFRDWAKAWRTAAEAGGAQFTLIGADSPAMSLEETPVELELSLPAAKSIEAAPGETANAVPVADDRVRLQDLLAVQAERADADVLWLVLIGHGTFDGDVAKFNARGPDVSAKELGEWLKPIPAPVAIINCTSGSGPFIPVASGPGRVVIAATKSGFELNFARFGKYLAAAIGDVAADLDKDGQTSLLEAYLTACRGVAEFYQKDQRLATEHALLDDNGDGLGTPAAWFRGVRATQRAKQGAALDGLRAHQLHLVRSDSESDMPPTVRARRDELELELAALRDQKAKLGAEAYYSELEPLLVELARLYWPADREASSE
jgi:hypothetical protein